MNFNRAKTKLSISTAVLLVSITSTLFSQVVEPIPFGDFEQWMVRHIKESVLLGGKTKTIYAISPNSVVVGTKPYLPSESPWGTSNALAIVAGIVKTSGTVSPADRGPLNRCAHLVSAFDSCKALGIVNIRVLVSGTLFLGETIEPVRGVNNPYSKINLGIPFSKRPKALLLDYKSTIPNTGIIVRSTGYSYSESTGEDPAMIFILLQNRAQQPDGSISALRVGTGYEFINHSSKEWVNNHQIPIHYGTIPNESSLHPQIRLGSHLYAKNTRGKNVEITETGWGNDDTPVTHIIVYISTGSQGAFIGALGNELWIDNVAFEY